MNTEQLKLLDLIAVLRQLGQVVDLTYLRDFVDATVPLFDGKPPLDSAENIEVRIDELLLSVRALTAMTRTTSDDAVYETIDNLLVDSDLKRPLSELVFWLLDGNRVEDRQSLVDWKSLDWEAILTVVRMIVEIIKSLR